MRFKVIKQKKKNYSAKNEVNLWEDKSFEILSFTRRTLKFEEDLVDLN